MIIKSFELNKLNTRLSINLLPGHLGKHMVHTTLVPLVTVAEGWLQNLAFGTEEEVVHSPPIHAYAGNRQVARAGDLQPLLHLCKELGNVPVKAVLRILQRSIRKAEQLLKEKLAIF